jgi:hypothetical protein
MEATARHYIIVKLTPATQTVKYLEQGASNIYFYERATPFIMGWFAGRTCKVTINGIPNHQNYYAIYVIYKRDRRPHNTSRRAALDIADMDFRLKTHGSCWSGKLQPNCQRKFTGESC